MKKQTIALLAVMASAPLAASSQEAFVTQIDGGQATISLSVPTAVSPSMVLDSLELPSGSVSVALPDLTEFPVPALPETGAYAMVNSNGNDNNASIVQDANNAGLIRQTGNLNMASITQNGFANRAAIYQASSNSTAMTVQSGRGNSALIVQR
ncbi:hypothetical protein [Roseovarius sp.]|uniref:hypothetical protein n=1 Tax=Roseovarius sp. TaxID=1486281 RepID=UPI00356B1216